MVSQPSLRRPSPYCGSERSRSQLTTAMTIAEAQRIPVGAPITAGQLSYDRAVLKLAPIVVSCRLIHSPLISGEVNKC